MSAKITHELVVEDLKNHKFIFVREEGTLREVADRLKEVYDKLKSLDISVSWYQTQESLSNKEDRFPTVFVMNRFDTILYEEIKDDYRIINPICVITSLNCIVKIPISSCRSLANMALRKCRVTSTSFSEEQTSLIRERVSLMGGEYTQHLLGNTTHLISEEVHSNKYDCAVKNNIAVVLYSWLDEAWVSSSSNPNFVAVNPSYTKKHRCPVFLKCNVVVSGFIWEERDEIVKLLKSNRANYTNDIVMDGDSQTTHLITKQGVSNTLRIARERHILVVTKDWVTDCVKCACRLPEENYSIDSKQKKVVTDTRQKRNTISDVITEKLNELDFEVDSCEEFLGGCNIYLCGFTDTQTNRIKKFLNLCRATRLSKLNANVTHVVMGCPTDNQLHEVASFSPAPSFILKYDWLIECWKQQSALSESEFIVKVAEIDKPSRKSSNKKYAEGSDSDYKLYLPGLSQRIKEEKILSNSNFLLIDPLPSMHGEIKRIIINNGGNLITEDSAITPDYVIVPLDFDKSITITTMLVTLYWLESSLFAKRLLESFEDPLFTPANGFGCRNILSDTTVMIERDRSIKLISIEQFLSYMGARVTDKLMDKVHVHVVLSDDPNHELVRKAKELDIPVVRLKWMIQCAHTNTKLPFADFYTYPSSQSSDSPPVSISSLSSRRSFFECDPAFGIDFEDPERYFPPGTTPKTAPHRSRGDITQLTEMYTDNIESLGTRNFSAKQETPEPFPIIDVISDNLSSGVLVGTKIAFSNRFTPQEITQMVNIVNELGGVYYNLYSSQMTHYIYSAKSNWSKESLLAKKENVVVVHPQWLFDIKRSAKLLDVINYPPSFDPDNNIGCVKVEKCTEPEWGDAWELMDTTQSPINNDNLLNFDFNVEPPDNRDNASISVGYNTPNFLSENTTHSRGKKRLRSPITPVYQTPSNCNLFNVVISDPEPDSTDDETISKQVEEVGPHTQEVFDKFENILCQELIEAEKQRNKPHDRMMIGQIQEFKVPSVSRRFSSVIQQKKYLLEHHSELSETRARIIWDPFRSEGYSPLPDSNPDTIDSTSSPFTPVHSHNYEETSSKSRTSTLQRSESCKTDSNSPLNSSLYSSQHTSHRFMLSCIEIDVKIRLGEIIKFLGGKCYSELSYDQHCTHLITGKIASHEKLFCAMAAGLYILKPEYIFKCQSSSKFVEEEPFEWGNPSINPSISKPIRNDKRLLATYWWRKELEERVHKNRSGMSLRKPSKTGVFEDWVVYLGCQNCKVKECKIKFCKRIISAGRGKTTYAINQRYNPTIAIIDIHCSSDTNLQPFKKYGIKVVSCQYLMEYLDLLGDEMQLKQFILQEALP